MLKNHIMRYIALLLSSKFRAYAHSTWWQLRSLLSPQLKNAEVFIRVDDPYSYLLVQVLPVLQQRFNIKWKVYIVSSLQKDMYPEPELWHQNASQDASQLANLYKLSSPTITQFSAESISSTTAKLLACTDSLENIKQVLDDFWQGKQTNSGPLSPQDKILLQDNEQRLVQRGHYLSGSIWYLGNWYWGLDRLDHFENKLNVLGLNRDAPKVYFNKTYIDFCRPLPQEKMRTDDQPTPIVLYFSIRSPYSHLALERCRKLSEHYNIHLTVKPIIPMIMRGLSVPSTKKFYIFFDTKREADKHNIDYGFVSDPLGDGVRRCYALYEYAQQEGKAIEYLWSYSKAVNAEGVLSETDKGLKLIVERSGLSWQIAKSKLSDNDWQTTWPSWAESNEDELRQQQLWGVPTIKYGDCIVWGQDRLEFIEQAIRQQLLE